MKLLIDENLPPSLMAILGLRFPETQHLHNVGLAQAPDAAIWLYAKEEGFTIITQDLDFQHRMFLYGPPPRVILVRAHGLKSTEIVGFVAMRLDVITAFELNVQQPMLILEA